MGQTFAQALFEECLDLEKGVDLIPVAHLKHLPKKQKFQIVRANAIKGERRICLEKSF